MRLYCYPFDTSGHEILTFPEALTATQELVVQIDRLIGVRWRWCDLRLMVVLRHPTYRIYEVEHRGQPLGRVTVLPCRTVGSPLESSVHNWHSDLPRSA